MFELSMGAEMGMGMRVTPALLNLAQLLSLPTLDLQQAVIQELSENPALEETEAGETPCVRCGGPVLDSVCLRCALSDGGTSSALSEDEIDPLLFVAAPPHLSEILLSELRASLPESDHPIATALIGSLDDRGFLVDDLDELAESLGLPKERFAPVLARLREIGPPGIATRDTRECLLAQIDQLASEGVTVPYVREIVADHLEDLSAKRLKPIAKALGITTEVVEEARRFVQRRLWPYPAEAALGGPGTPSRTRYQVADLAFRKDERNKLTVEVMHSPRRMVRINPLYQELAAKAASLDENDRAHVQEYIGRARVFLANLRQRESTLKRIGDELIDRQKEFLLHGVRHLAPLTRAEIAATLGVHESTISRAVADKTALLPDQTLLPLSEFFVAARNVQDVLGELIVAEKKPLSDQELAELLTERGFSIARRTVAKYRSQMRILPAHLR